MDIFSPPFLSASHKQAIVAAIQAAEKKTSGEIRVHIEKSCGDMTPIERAKVVFREKKMDATKLRNGVILYIAYGDKKFAVWGDVGIHQQVGEDYWQSIVDSIHHYFQKAEFEEGIIIAVRDIGEKLKVYFPFTKKDTNELSDEISEG